MVDLFEFPSGSTQFSGTTNTQLHSFCCLMIIVLKLMNLMIF